MDFRVGRGDRRRKASIKTNLGGKRSFSLNLFAFFLLLPVSSVADSSAFGSSPTTRWDCRSYSILALLVRPLNAPPPFDGTAGGSREESFGEPFVELAAEEGVEGRKVGSPAESITHPPSSSSSSTLSSPAQATRTLLASRSRKRSTSVQDSPSHLPPSPLSPPMGPLEKAANVSCKMSMYDEVCFCDENRSGEAR